MRFIKELKKYIGVDVYGPCSNIINPGFGSCIRHSKECLKIQSRYKFYLAIENSFCPDYVSEKYYKYASRNIVPVVMGSGNYSDPRNCLSK